MSFCSKIFDGQPPYAVFSDAPYQDCAFSAVIPESAGALIRDPWLNGSSGCA